MLIDDESEAYVRYSIALGHLAALLKGLENVQLQARIQDPRWIRSASDRHLYQTGHRLRFGCCAPKADAREDVARPPFGVEQLEL